MYIYDKNHENKRHCIMMQCISHQLPVLCSFQELSYTITITSEDKQSLQRSRATMNGSEDCIIEEFAENLVEGIEYNALVFIDTGPLTGNSSSRTLTFSM